MQSLKAEDVKTFSDRGIRQTIKKTTLLTSLVLFLSPLFFVTVAYGVEEGDIDVNLLDIPYWLGVRLGLSTWQAGILASLIVLAIFMFPIMILTRGKGSGYSLIFGVGSLCFLTAIGWFPIYGIIILILLIAGLNAKSIRDVLTD